MHEVDVRRENAPHAAWADVGAMIHAGEFAVQLAWSLGAITPADAKAGHGPWVLPKYPAGPPAEHCAARSKMRVLLHFAGRRSFGRGVPAEGKDLWDGILACAKYVQAQARSTARAIWIGQEESDRGQGLPPQVAQLALGLTNSSGGDTRVRRSATKSRVGCR